jgi:hypothetical protein
MPVLNEQDFLLLAREVMLQLLELQTQIGTLRLAVQRHGITLEELQACQSEFERRLQIEDKRRQIRALGLVDLLQVLKDYKGTIQ